MNNETMNRLDQAWKKLNKALDDDNKRWRRRQAMKLTTIVVGSFVAGMLYNEIID